MMCRRYLSPQKGIVSAIVVGPGWLRDKGRYTSMQSVANNHLTKALDKECRVTQ